MSDTSETEHEWQRLLAGGFAFQSAPFAVHPLDKGRAKEAITLAKANGVTKAEFLAEAERYLRESRGWKTSVNEHLARVDKFVGSKLF